MEIRPLTALDMDQARRLWEECFDDHPSFLDWYFQFRFQPQDGLGVFSNRRLLSDLHLSPRKIKLRQQVFPSAYLIALATHPDFRRQGLAKKLLTFALRHLAANHLFFTFLMPFKVEFYTRLGWGVCCRHQHFTLPTAASGTTPGTEKNNSSVPFQYRPVEPDQQVLAMIYQRWITQFDTALVRTAQDWESLLREHQTDGGQFWLAFNQTDPLGYALTLTAPPPESQFQIREMAYIDQAVRDPFLTRLLGEGTGLNSLRSKAEALLWTAPETESSCVLTPSALHPVILGRITNVEQALTAFTYPTVNDQFSLEVYDPLLPENSGTYHLQLSAGRMQVFKTRIESAQVRCSISTLTRLLTGAIHPPAAVKSGELSLKKPELLPLLTELFPKTTAYINEYF
ncbi:MAG: GNAT family N-acetyltransferase [Firmicutes bacterium]|nr:GNAT family N-acetyltransferase [Bacillota bacterium]